MTPKKKGNEHEEKKYPNRLRYLRGMRPAEIIAARLMISTNYYYAIEGGYAMPSDDLMYRICLLHGLPAHMIWLDPYGVETWD